MKKPKEYYVCRECNHNTLKWLGKCPSCHSWNSFESEEEHIIRTQKTHYIKPQNIKQNTTGHISRSVSLDEFDRVLGGGLVKSSITLLGGEPGVGKSTLLLEVSKALTLNSQSILYVSGEETVEQISSRCNRIELSSSKFKILDCNILQKVFETTKAEMPDVLILDSIQTLVGEDTHYNKNSTSALKEMILEIMNFSKLNNIITLVIGHITKDGNIAGPKMLEHMVDTVLKFEGNSKNGIKSLRCTKNRFGNVKEVGLFELNQIGISPYRTKSISDFKEEFLEGSANSCVLSGSFPIILEIQSLVLKNKYDKPLRVVQGIETNRLSIMIAIIDKLVKLPIKYSEVYVSISNGLKSQERSSDLCIIASLISSIKMKEISNKYLYLGEVSLNGKISLEQADEDKIEKILKLGVKKIITSKKTALKYNLYKDKIVGIEHVSELVNYLN